MHSKDKVDLKLNSQSFTDLKRNTLLRCKTIKQHPYKNQFPISYTMYTHTNVYDSEK